MVKSSTCELTPPLYACHVGEKVLSFELRTNGPYVRCTYDAHERAQRGKSCIREDARRHAHPEGSA